MLSYFFVGKDGCALEYRLIINRGNCCECKQCIQKSVEILFIPLLRDGFALGEELMDESDI